MKTISQITALVVMVAIGVFAWRVMDRWTTQHTTVLLVGILFCVLIAVLGSAVGRVLDAKQGNQRSNTDDADSLRYLSLQLRAERELMRNIGAVSNASQNAYGANATNAFMLSSPPPQWVIEGQVQPFGSQDNHWQ